MMRDMETCREEIFRRSHERIRERKRRQKMALTMCVPLVLCLVIGALTFPRFIGGGSSLGPNGAVQPDGVIVSPDNSEKDGAPQPSDGIPDYSSVPSQSNDPDGEQGKDMRGSPGEGETSPELIANPGANPNQGEETWETDGTDEVMALLGRLAEKASGDGEKTVEARYDTEHAFRIIVTTPRGEQRIYRLDGNVLTSETDSWELVLSEEEETTLRDVLLLPEYD